MKNNDYSQTYLKRISITNIPADIHRLGLTDEIAKLLIDNGIFFISQVAQLTEHELSQYQGISPIIAEKIKRGFCRYRWKTSEARAIQGIEQLRLQIESSRYKADILKIPIDDLNLSAKTSMAFYLSDIRTIEDLIKLSKHRILQMRGIGRIRYEGILNSIRETIKLYEPANVDVGKLKSTNLFDGSLNAQSNLTFLEVLTILFNTFKPRDCEIFFEYYLTHRARHGAYKRIGDEYNLTRERIRKICEKGLRLLRHTGRKNCITTYLNTVWKQKVQNFVVAKGGKVTRLTLEQKFAADLPAIYLIQYEILQIEDLWASVLLKDEQGYYLPDMKVEKL